MRCFFVKFKPVIFLASDFKASHPPLKGDRDVDVAVIGAGFTGLSAARLLAAEGVSAAVVERSHIGHGASGRNCGQIGAELGTNLAGLKKGLGHKGAGQSLSVLKKSIEHLESLIDEKNWLQLCAPG
jgi:gamma-glutamylputrescine oxidase